MRTMSSVGPTRGKADNTAGPIRPLFSDWLPVRGFHPGPEPTKAPTKEAVDTSAVQTFRSSVVSSRRGRNEATADEVIS